MISYSRRCITPRFFSAWAGYMWDWLIVWCLTLSRSYRGGQCTYPCIPGILFTCTPHNILSKTLAAFPQNHCRNTGQRWERNESCRNDYHQFSDRIVVESEDRTSDLLFSSPVRYRLSNGAWRICEPCSGKSKKTFNLYTTKFNLFNDFMNRF